MALVKKATPSFEQEPATNAGDTAVAEKPQQIETPQDASVGATTAIAKAATSSLTTTDAATAAKQFKKDVEAMKDAADFSWGSMRVFKANNGTIKEMGGEKLDLGRWVKVQLLAWGRHFEVSPGEEGASSAAFVGYSKDGETIDYIIGEDNKSWEGKSMAEYVEHLKTAEEFERAAVREFIDTQVAVLGSEEEPDFRGIVQVTLSSSSIPSFKKYQTELEATARCVSMSLPGYNLPENPFQFYMVREAAERGKQSWTKLKLLPSLPAKI